MEKAIIELYRQGKTHRYIANTLHVGLRKVGNVIHFYKNTNEIMKPPKRGRKPTISENIKEYIEIRTLQDATLSSTRTNRKTNTSEKNILSKDVRTKILFRQDCFF